MAAGDAAAGVIAAPVPRLTETDARRILRDAFGVDPDSVRSLGSNQDLNFLVSVGDERMLLKIAHPSTPPEAIEAQSAASARIVERAIGVRAPRARRADDGTTVRIVEHEGVRLPARLLEFLAGRTLSGGGHLSARRIRALGGLAARVDAALHGLDVAGVERVDQWDLRRAPAALAAALPHVADAGLRDHLASSAEAAQARIDAVADQLPVQPIHGDLTDDNVVASDPVTGIPDGVIDLGDLNRTWAVSELAITVSSLLHHDGVDAVAALRAASAYHAARPLTPAETTALWPLIVVRAAVLVASAHQVIAADPRNAYAAENLAHERAILAAATSVPLDVGDALVRLAVGEDVTPLDLPPAGPLMPTLIGRRVAVVDLSPTSPLMDGGRWLDPGAERALADDALGGADAAVLRFGEPRLTRAHPLHADAPETVPLGLELALAEPHDVCAPWPGALRARPGGVDLHSDDLVLEVDGVDPTAEGEVSAGSVIGRARDRIVVRARRLGVPLPEFVGATMLSAWRAVAADPAALIDPGIPRAAALDAAELASRRERSFAAVQEHYFDEPPLMVRGWREYLVDDGGRVYLDVLNNVTAVGHAHPAVVAAAARQWQLLNTNSRFHYPAVAEYAQRLADLAPDPLDTVFLVNSGSEAVDLALRLARAATGRREVLAVREAYHGWTDLSDAVSTSIADNPGALQSRPSWVHTLDAPNVYRGRHRGAEAHRYAVDAVAEIERLAHASTPPGAFVAETFFGNAGGLRLPDGYLAAVYEAVRRHGGLAIADEVQVGFGRLGEWFWGFEQQGVVPDIVAVAKSVGNGHPLGAVITSRPIADAFEREGSFFSSTGGSPVSSRIGLAVLDVLEHEGLQRNARETGAYFRHRLEDLGHRHPLIGAVHGAGLYLGLELVRDPASLEPAAFEARAICERLRSLGVLTYPTGDHRNVLKLKPPLMFTRDDVDAVVDALEHVLMHGW